MSSKEKDRVHLMGLLGKVAASGAVVAFLLCGAVATGAQDALPAAMSPTQLLNGWLAAYNTGDVAVMRQFHVDHFVHGQGSSDPATDATGDMSIFVNDGPYAVEGTETVSPNSSGALLRGSETGFWIKISIVTGKTDPSRIGGFSYRHVETPAQFVPHERSSGDQIKERAERLTSMLAKRNAFSGAVLIAKDGKPIFVYACGFANVAWKQPARIDTRFNIASLEKMFTGVAIAQLVEQGKLHYEDTVASLVPEYRDNDAAGKITVHQLLTHTSGLDSRSFGEFRKGYRSLKPYLQSFDNSPLEFAPGAKYSYSNDGFLLLGLIVEHVSQQSFDEYLQTHIFSTAGMTSTGNFEVDGVTPLAEGYMDRPSGGRRSNVLTLPAKGLPFGLGYSTVEDMMRFSEALRDGRLVKPETLATLWNPKTEETGADGKYGYGFFIREHNGVRIVGHSGGWAGVTTQMDMYPDLGYTVVILTNYDDSPRTLAYKIEEWLTQGTLASYAP
jgi:CubicO group peptidase (beta-lactamase class C family)